MAFSRRDLTVKMLAAGAAWIVTQPAGAEEADQVNLRAPGSPSVHLVGGHRFSGWMPFINGTAAHLIIPGVLNGAPISAVIDTGAARTIVDRQTATRLQLPVQGQFSLRGVTASAQGQMTGGVNLQLGDLALGGLTATVLDLSMFAAATGRPVDVIIGRELFEAALADVDFPNGRVGFYDLTAPPSVEGAVQASLISDDRGRRTVRLSIRGAGPIEAIYDLGCDTPLVISPVYAAQAGLLEGLKTSSVASAGIEGMGIGTVAVLPSVRIGDFTLLDVPVEVPSSWSQSTPILAGLPIWNRFRNVVDYPRSRLSLVPGPNALTAPFPKDRSGIGATRVDGQLQIIYVAPGSPAGQAGLHAGDVIAKIDGHWVDAAYLANNPRLGERPAGTRSTLTLGDGRTVELTLADYF